MSYELDCNGSKVPVTQDQRTSVRWKLLVLLFALAFVAYVLRLNFSILAERIMPEFGISQVELGWIMAGFLAGYAAFQVPGGLLGEKIGTRRTLALIALLWGVVTFLTGALPGLLVTTTAGAIAVFIGLQLLMGVVQAPIFPIQSGVIAEWFPSSGWALPNALIGTGLGLGAAVTPPAVAWLMLQVGWRDTLFLMAPLSLVALIWWWYGRDRPAEHHAVGAEELSLITAGQAPPEKHVPAWPLLKRLTRNRQVNLLTLAYLAQGYVFWIFANWFFLYLVQVRGLSVLESGFLTSVPWIVSSITTGIGGAVCDRLCKRIGPRWGCSLPCIICMPLQGAFLAAGAIAPDPYWAVALFTVALALNLFVDPIYWAGMTFVTRQHAATANGIMNTGGNLGGLIALPLLPLIAEWIGWQEAIISGSVVIVLGTLPWFFIDVSRPIEPVTRQSV